MGWWWTSAPPATNLAASPPSPPDPRDQAHDPQDESAALSAFLTSLDAPAAAQPPLRESETLYPTALSCTSCFDQAYYCSSLGGQLTNIYRYGGMRSCSDLWAQWRFCMRTKAMGEETRKQRIREWEMAKVGKYKTGRSSEDVWSVRRVGVGEGAFGKDIDAVEEETKVGC